MCKATQLIGELSEDERMSLAEIGRGPVHARIPDAHAEKLLSLGLAEVVLGDEELTLCGRRAVRIMRR